MVESRDDFVRRTLNEWKAAKPDHNIMVINNKHKHLIRIDGEHIHDHVEIPTSYQHRYTHGFDIYVFKSGGVITRGGDGGWINWGFSGKFERINDNTVKFFAY